MSDILVFITATINCGGTPFVKRSDPAVRRRDYLRGFRSWLVGGCETDVLFCENSGADLADFKREAASLGRADSVRFLSFSGNAGAERFGKGYGEIEMLKRAFESYPEIENYRYIIKASGRYEILNSVKMISRLSKMNADIICDMQAYLTWVDTVTFVVTPHVATVYLIPYQGELDDSKECFLEKLMARCVHRSIIGGCTWAPFPCALLNYGLSGTSNKQRFTPYLQAKLMIKRSLRRFAFR